MPRLTVISFYQVFPSEDDPPKYSIPLDNPDLLVFWLKRKSNNYATQPCPCGYHNHPDKDCVCSPQVVSRYLNKISGPLLDRIDLHVEVTPVSFDELASMERPSEDSKTILERVLKAREMQAERFKDLPNIYSNAQMPSRMVREVCQIDAAGQMLVKKAMEKLQLSARAYDRILKVARTAADLNGKEKVEIGHLAEAIHFFFRSLDRESWVG